MLSVLSANKHMRAHRIQIVYVVCAIANKHMRAQNSNIYIFGRMAVYQKKSLFT